MHLVSTLFQSPKNDKCLPARQPKQQKSENGERIVFRKSNDYFETTTGLINPETRWLPVRFRTSDAAGWTGFRHIGLIDILLILFRQGVTFCPGLVRVLRLSDSGGLRTGQQTVTLMCEQESKPGMSGLAQDLRYALRQLRKSPGFACTAILILTLGIAASTAIFAFVDAALIAPLPYRDPASLVEVTESAPMFPRGADLSYPDYLDWKRLNEVLSSLDVYEGTQYLLRNAAGTEPVLATRVSDGFFHTLGITPALGRDFIPGEDLPQAPPTVMLSYATWQRRFGGKRGIVGQPVMLSGVAYTIIGVLPRTFEFAPAGRPEFWTALHPDDHCSSKRDCHDLIGVGRLKDDVPVVMARANMQAIARQLEIQYPESNRGQGAYVQTLSEQIVSDIRPILLVLLSRARLLMLIACVNVSSRCWCDRGRKREIAVRGALGASRSRLMRQFSIEGLACGVAGMCSIATPGSPCRLSPELFPRHHRHMPFLDGLDSNKHVMTLLQPTQSPDDPVP